MMKLPNRCFVSHSFDDVDAVNKLAACVNSRGVKLDKFKWIEPDITSAVSNKIIPKIRRCGGLIYLKGGESAKSDWVKFERDYALRLGKSVFSFDPKTSKLRPDKGRPLDLRVQSYVSEESAPRAGKLIRWMRQSRHFHLEEATPVRKLKEIKPFFEAIANAQQLVLWLIDVDTQVILTYERNFKKSDPEFDVPPDWWPTPAIYARIGFRWRLEPEIAERAAFETSYRPPELDIDLVKGAPKGELNWNQADALIMLITHRLTELPPVVGSE